MSVGLGARTQNVQEAPRAAPRDDGQSACGQKARLRRTLRPRRPTAQSTPPAAGGSPAPPQWARRAVPSWMPRPRSPGPAAARARLWTKGTRVVRMRCTTSVCVHMLSMNQPAWKVPAKRACPAASSVHQAPTATAGHTQKNSAASQSPLVMPQITSTMGSMMAMRCMSRRLVERMPSSKAVWRLWPASVPVASPNMVRAPVAPTTPRALPEMTVEPMKARSTRSVRAQAPSPSAGVPPWAPGLAGDARFSTGSDSPVREERVRSVMAHLAIPGTRKGRPARGGTAQETLHARPRGRLTARRGGRPPSRGRASSPWAL